MFCLCDDYEVGNDDNMLFIMCFSQCCVVVSNFVCYGYVEYGHFCSSYSGM